MNKKHFLLFAVGFGLTASAASNNDLIKKNIKNDDVVMMLERIYTVTARVKNMLHNLPKERIICDSLNYLQISRADDLLNKTLAQTKIKKSNPGKPYELIIWASGLWNEWDFLTAPDSLNNPIKDELALFHNRLILQKKHSQKRPGK